MSHQEFSHSSEKSPFLKLCPVRSSASAVKKVTSTIRRQSWFIWNPCLPLTPIPESFWGTWQASYSFVSASQCIKTPGHVQSPCCTSVCPLPSQYRMFRSQVVHIPRTELKLNIGKISGSQIKANISRELAKWVCCPPTGVISLVFGKKDTWLSMDIKLEAPISLSKSMLASRLPQSLVTSTFYTPQCPHTSMLALLTSPKLPDLLQITGFSPNYLSLLIATLIFLPLPPALSHQIALAKSSLVSFSLCSGLLWMLLAISSLLSTRQTVTLPLMEPLPLLAVSAVSLLSPLQTQTKDSV